MEPEGLLPLTLRRPAAWWTLASTITIELDIEHEVLVETAPVDRLHCVTEAGGVGAEGSVHVVQCMGHGIYCINHKHDRSNGGGASVFSQKEGAGVLANLCSLFLAQELTR